jgi:poly(3-hydroxybutyrate) depolymerase
MRLFFTYTLVFLCFLVFFSFSTENALSQQTGSFDKQITEGLFTGQVSFYVPATPPPTEGFPVIIGFHYAKTSGTVMRDMMLSSAQQIGAVLACPEGMDGDGSAAAPVLEWIKRIYKADAQKVFLTGYGAGGYPAIRIGVSNVALYRGIVAIAPNISTLDVNTPTIAEIAIGVIVGKTDQLYDNIKSVVDVINQNGGTTKFVEKDGVDHTGTYFGSQEFATDWISCYNFCLNSVLKPAKATLLKPNDLGIDQPLQVNLSWDKLKNVSSYKIEISTSSGIFKSDVVTTESYDLPDLQKNTKYSWKVCGVNVSGSGEWSDTWSFTTYNDAPTDVAVLQEPPNNADIKGPDLLFKWKTVLNATKYHFQIYEDASSIMFAQDSNITSSGNYAQYNGTKLKSGMKYRWRVRAYNKYGSSAWSEEWKFTVIPNPPTSKTILQEPGDNAVNQTLNLKFKWTIVSTAENYHLQITNKKDNSIFYNDSTIAKPKSGNYVEVYVNGFSAETQYSWKVRGLNKGGSGPWSNEFNLTTMPGTSVLEILPSIFEASVYPNPTEGNTVLSFKLQKDGISNIEIYNSMGIKLDIPFQTIYSAGDYKLHLNLFEYPNGAYYIKIISDNKVEIKGFIIIK